VGTMDIPVYFASARARSFEENRITKIQKLFDAADLADVVMAGDLTAIKVHFGEIGSDAYVSPVYVRQIIDKVKACGAKPFVTDTNTLYGGGRGNSVDHLATAVSHGFTSSVLGAPVFISDGLKGENYSDVVIDKNHFQAVKIAGGILEADSMIVVSHFKGHLLSGFGGAIKNLGMGCAPAEGKAEQHSTRPIFKQELCLGCGKCEEACPRSAITVETKISHIDYNACRGCGECLRLCPAHALDMEWSVQIPPFLERMAEYAYGAVKDKPERVGYFNFLLNIVPDCDCIPWTDLSIVPDLGIMASKDPVAIDSASLDLVNGSQGLGNALLQKNKNPGEDKFKGVWEYTQGPHLLEYAESIGLGSARYRMITV
jgi:uncharacterized protein